MRKHPLDTSDLDILSDVPYIDDGSPCHLLDIYRPKGASPDIPVIVNIHGGGLFASSDISCDKCGGYDKEGYPETGRGSFNLREGARFAGFPERGEGETDPCLFRPVSSLAGE